jgi:prophage regulatory protein
MRFIRAKQLYGRDGITGLSRSSFFRAVKDGTFPAPVQIGVRAVAFRSDAVQAWAASRPARNRAVQSQNDLTPEAPA